MACTREAIFFAKGYKDRGYKVSILLGIAKAIDQCSKLVGSLAGIGLVLMVLVGLFNVFSRFIDKYLGTSLSSNSLLELQWYLFSFVFLLAGAYVLSQDEHVRVDLLYGKLSQKKKAIINLLGTLFFLIPFCIIILWVAVPWFTLSFNTSEMSSDPGGLIRWPVKLLLPVAIGLLLLQAIAELFKAIGVLKGAYQYTVQSEIEQAAADVQQELAVPKTSQQKSQKGSES